MTNDISTALRTLRLDPDDENAGKALSSLPSAETDPGACEELSPVLAAERAFHAEMNNLAFSLRLLDAEGVVASSPAARAALLVEKARLLWAELWQVEAARDVLKRAFELSPDLSEAKALLREFEQEDSGWQEQAESLSAQAAEAGESPAAAAFLALEADLLLRHRNLPDEGEALYRRSVQLEPGNRRANFALERLLGKRGRENVPIVQRRLQRRRDA